MDEPPQLPLDDATDRGGLTTVELEDALTARTSRRRRLARGALVVAALVIALGTLLRGALPLSHWSLAFGQTSANSTPTSRWHVQQRGGSGATAAPGPITIYSNVSYGAVTLNGQRLRGAPPISIAALRPGTNTLKLDAAPFLPALCYVDAIGASTEGGTAYQATPPCSIQGSSDGVYIYITLTPQSLPSEMVVQALNELRDAVGRLPTEYAEVPAGEYYATGLAAGASITYARTNQPLGARLDYRANTENVTLSATVNSPFRFGSRCIETDCGGDYFLAPQGVAAWLVNEPVLMTMRFLAPSGAELGEVTLPSATPQAFALAYRSDGTWQTVNLQPSSAAQVAPGGPIGAGGPGNSCATGFDLLFAQLQAARSPVNGYGFGGATNVLKGCRITVISTNGQVVFLWRFGVLLAADAGAHALLPALPLAPPSAIQGVLAVPTP